MDANQATAESPASRSRLAIWLTTSLLAGAVILVLEMLAFRLYAPYFGYSIYVWGNMICVVMVALVIGYSLGGWLADRSKTDMPLYILVMVSGLYQLAIVFTVHPLLQWLSKQGEITGTILATLIVFTPPMTLLATVGPYLIRLLAKQGHVGTTAGRIYALSTVGSIIGIIATIFWLVPSMGTQTTLKIACGITIVVGVMGLMQRRRAAAALLALVALLPLSPRPAWAKKALWVSESAYNLIRVIKDGDRKVLLLNHVTSAHSIKVEGKKFTGFYFDDFALGPLLVPARKALLLGMGAGMTIFATRLTAPSIAFDAVEIDPMVVEAATKYFELPANAPWLKIYVADARPWLASNEQKYDIVQMDLYQGGDYIPFYLATRECFAMVRQHLSDDGLLMMNVFDPSSSQELLSAMVKTVRQEFPTVYVLSRPQGNHIMFAFARPVSREELKARLWKPQPSEEVQRFSRGAESHIKSFEPYDGSPVLTDDLSPLEAITRRTLAEAKIMDQPSGP